jgi:DNA-binding CsgD family transcriptional regulator
VVSDPRNSATEDDSGSLLSTDIAESLANILMAESVVELSERYFSGVAGHVPSFAQGVYLHSTDAEHPSSIEVRGLSRFYVTQYERYGRNIDPVVQTAIATGRVTDSSEIPENEWRGSPVVTDVFSEHNMGHVMCAPFRVGGVFGGTLNFARTPDAPAFADADRQRASMVAALFGAGVFACRRFEKSRLDLDLHVDALDHCGIAVIFTNLDDAERTPNAGARRLLDSLVDPWPTLGPALESTDGDDSTELRFDGRDGAQVAIRVSTVRRRSDPVTVSILHPTTDIDVVYRPELVALLTGREAEVARAVGVGLHDKEVARLLHMSPHTVKHHLKVIYRKLGVHSRIEMVNALCGRL